MSAVTTAEAQLEPAVKQLQSKATFWVDLARSLQIEDAESFEEAAEHLKTIKGLIGEADARFDPIIKKAHEAHAEAIKQKRVVTDPLTQAEALIKSGMATWKSEQDRARIAEQNRLNEIARQQARIQREQQIVHAEEDGASADEVKSMAAAPLRVAPVTIAPTVQRVAGISARETWKAEVSDLLTLVKFVAANPQFLGLLQANSVAIGAMARSMRQAMNIPGVRTWSETNIGARRGS